MNDYSIFESLKSLSELDKIKEAYKNGFQVAVLEVKASIEKEDYVLAHEDCLNLIDSLKRKYNLL